MYNKEYQKEWYQRTKEQRHKWQREYYKKNKERIKQRDKKYKQELSKFINEIKLKSGCELCGYNEHSAALCFHHKNSENKETEIANLINSKYSKKRVLKEISKCIVLCANCHNILHSKKQESKE